MTTDILAFDVGVNIVGILDLNTDRYTPYRGSDRVLGARRLIECEGIIVSFNGCYYDLSELAKLVGLASPKELEVQGRHCDTQIAASVDRWPPDPGTKPIWGPDLQSQYEHYFDSDPPNPPNSARDDYEQSNWRDCYMAGCLWKKICGARDECLCKSSESERAP